MIKFIVSFIIMTALIFPIYADVKIDTEEIAFKLFITDFVEASPLEEAGAQTGDMILKYNSTPVTSLKQLAKLKQSVLSDEVEIILMRDNEEISVQTKQGALGVYLREYAPDHELKEDAVVIPNIDQLGWGMGMENSFLGCLTLLEKDLGNSLSYSDLTGLSAYGFRTHFFAGYCPSSPDATVGKDVGSLLMERLGYSVKYIYLKGEEDPTGEYNMMNKEEMLEEIKYSIDRGFPVIAIDLLEIPEWGLITGYQADGEELFCRSYFDKTRGYEIAQKFPWVIMVIDYKIETNLTGDYDRSLDLAYEMYTTDAYGKYYSGLKAIEEWIKILRRSSFYPDLSEERKVEVFHANWWIFFSLFEAKFNALTYLQENRHQFRRYKRIIPELINIYLEETELMADYEKVMPNPYMGGSFATWGTKQRLEQVKVLQKLFELEKDVVMLLSQFSE